MENEKISVIMGVYNSKPELLTKSIDSILSQTYSNFEFIICNDCSTDYRVMEILSSYQQKDKRIRIIKNEKNMGLAASLNNCLSYSTGLYIARMDDDDYSVPYRFKKQVEFLNSEKEYDIVGSNIRLIDSRGVWGSSKNIEKPIKEDFLFGTPFTHPTVMVRKEMYDKVNGYRICNRTKRTEDYDLFMRMYACGAKGYNIQEELYWYYFDNNTYRKQKFKYRIDEIIIRFEGFKKLGLMPKGLVYCFKPILSYLIPNSIKQKRLNNSQEKIK